MSTLFMHCFFQVRLLWILCQIQLILRKLQLSTDLGVFDQCLMAHCVPASPNTHTSAFAGSRRVFALADEASELMSAEGAVRSSSISQIEKHGVCQIH